MGRPQGHGDDPTRRRPREATRGLDLNNTLNNTLKPPSHPTAARLGSCQAAGPESASYPTPVGRRHRPCRAWRSPPAQAPATVVAITQRRRRGRFRLAATAAPYQPHRRCHIALSRCAIDGEARQSPPDWVELRPGRDDRSRGHLLERSERRLALRSSWAVARPARIFGLLVDGQSRPIWASLIRVADHVRAGMEVMFTEDDH